MAKNQNVISRYSIKNGWLSVESRTFTKIKRTEIRCESIMKVEYENSRPILLLPLGMILFFCGLIVLFLKIDLFFGTFLIAAAIGCGVLFFIIKSSFIIVHSKTERTRLPGINEKLYERFLQDLNSEIKKKEIIIKKSNSGLVRNPTFLNQP
ncbi:hypothetical protein [Candidatus Harpocratesius sp.]